MHTYCNDWGTFGYLLRAFLTGIGVPFFFIGSGFLYVSGLQRTDSPRKYAVNYVKRIMIMYVLWTIITLPISIYNINIAYPGINVIMLTLHLIRQFVFVGSLGVYWYVLALIYNSIMLYISYIYRLDKLILAVALLAFAVGVLYGAGIFPEESFVYRTVHVIFGSERNFLSMGLLYMWIGLWMATHTVHCDRYKLWIAFAIVMILRLAETLYSPVQFLQLPSAILLFLIALNSPMQRLGMILVKLRRLSVVMYLVHFPFILVFDYYLHRGTIIDYPLTLLLCIVVWVIANRFLPKKVYRAFFG